MADEEQLSANGSDVELDASVGALLQEDELTYAIKNSRRTLLQEAAKEHPDWTFADLRATYDEDGQRANSQKTQFASTIFQFWAGAMLLSSQKSVDSP
jgi:hypothetical protein